MNTLTKDIDEQVHQLRLLGLQFDETDLRRVLLEIGFYHLGFYSHHFKEHRPSGVWTFREGLTLDHILSLYHFDSELRGLLYQALLRVEFSLRSRLLVEGTMAHREDDCWLCHEPYVCAAYAASFERMVYRRIKMGQRLIKKHHQKHPRERIAPAYKTMEFMTFGEVIHLYESLTSSDLKRRVARHYGLQHIGDFVSYLKALRDLRNVCAHGQILFDLRLSTRGRIGSIPSQVPQHGGVLTLFRLVEILCYFLSKLHGAAGESLAHRVKQLLLGQPDFIQSIIYQTTGYPR